MPSLFLLSFCPNSSVSAGRGVCLQCRTTRLRLSHHFIVHRKVFCNFKQENIRSNYFPKRIGQVMASCMAWRTLSPSFVTYFVLSPLLVALLNLFKSPECEKKTVSPFLQTQYRWEGASINKPLKSCQYMNFYFYLAFPINTRNLPSHPRETNGLNIRSCHTATLINWEESLQWSTCKTNLYNSSEPEDHTS